MCGCLHYLATRNLESRNDTNGCLPHQMLLQEILLLISIQIQQPGMQDVRMKPRLRHGSDPLHKPCATRVTTVLADFFSSHLPRYLNTQRKGRKHSCKLYAIVSCLWRPPRAFFWIFPINQDIKHAPSTTFQRCPLPTRNCRNIKEHKMR